MPLFHKRNREADAEETDSQTSAQALLPEQAVQEELTPDVDAAVRLISEKRLRTRKGALVWLWTAFAPIAAWMAFVNFMNGELDWMVVNGLFLATALTLNRLTAELDRAQVALQTNLDKSWLGALVDALEWPNRRIQGIARYYLVRLLPTVTQADAALLEEAQRDSLYARLAPRAALKDAPFTLAILKSLEHIGDAGAVPLVAQLAKIPAFTPRRDTLRQAARACLPALERRVLKQRLAPALAEAQTALSVEEAQPLTSAPQMEPEVVERLKKLEAECRKAQPGMRLGFLLASWGIIFPYTTIMTGIGVYERNWLQALTFGLLAAGTTQLHRLTLNSKHRAMARFLAEQESVQAVGTLAEALDWPDAYIRHVALRGLTKLLPQMRASDTALLNPRQRASLYRMLTMANARTHTRFLEILLKALEQIGDEAAVPYVENLEKSKPLTSQQQRVHNAAVACLPFLREQAKLGSYSQTLLRAASANDIPVETLLRPVSGPQDVEPAYLLRADTTERV